MSFGKPTLTPQDLPEEFNSLSPEQKSTLLLWIHDNLSPVKSITINSTSYGLKHFFEKSDNGFYVTNGMFKGAMLEAGFFTNNRDDLNWHFNVSRKSVKKLYEWINSR